MRQPGKLRFGFLKRQQGFSLLETMIALGILAFIGVAFLTSLSTASKSTDLYEQRVTALSLAQSQLEEIKALAYDPDAHTKNPAYPLAVTPPSGYEVSISAVERATDKQEVTVAVSRGEHHILQLTTIKTNW